MPHRRSTSRRNSRKIYFKYRDPNFNVKDKSDKYDKYLIVLVVGIIIAILIL